MRHHPPLIIPLSMMIQDALIRLSLLIENLRAQTNDGSLNISGKQHGCQTEIKKCQPLDPYAPCGSHVTHLVIYISISCAPHIHYALDCVHELGKTLLRIKQVQALAFRNQ